MSAATAAGAAPSPAPVYRSGSLGGRLRDPLVLGLFVGAFIALVGMTVVAVTLAGPGAARPFCRYGDPCPLPPGPPRFSGTIWRSSALRFQIEYDETLWEVKRSSPAALELRSGTMLLSIRGERSADPQRLLDERLGELRAKMPDLAPNRPRRRLLGPTVGYRDGVGGAYCGTLRGELGKLDVLALAATDGDVSAVETIVTVDCEKPDGPARSEDLGEAQSVLDSFRWPGEGR